MLKTRFYSKRGRRTSTSIELGPCGDIGLWHGNSLLSLPPPSTSNYSSFEQLSSFFVVVVIGKLLALYYLSQILINLLSGLFKPPGLHFTQGLPQPLPATGRFLLHAHSPATNVFFLPQAGSSATNLLFYHGCILLPQMRSFATDAFFCHGCILLSHMHSSAMGTFSCHGALFCHIFPWGPPLYTQFLMV